MIDFISRYHISWVIFLSFNWKTEDEMNQWMWKRVWLKIIVISKETNEIVLVVLSSSYFLTMIQIYGLNLILMLKTLHQWNELYRRCDRKLWRCWLVCVAGYKRLGTGRSHWARRKCNPQVNKNKTTMNKNSQVIFILWKILNNAWKVNKTYFFQALTISEGVWRSGNVIPLRRSWYFNTAK